MPLERQEMGVNNCGNVHRTVKLEIMYSCSVIVHRFWFTVVPGPCYVLTKVKPGSSLVNFYFPISNESRLRLPNMKQIGLAVLVLVSCQAFRAEPDL